MDNNLKYMFAIGFGLILMGLGKINWSPWTGQNPSDKGFSYEMARFDSFEGHFDLSDREIDRQVLENEIKTERKIQNQGKDTKAAQKTEDKSNKSKNKKQASKKKKSGLDVNITDGTLTSKMKANTDLFEDTPQIQNVVIKSDSKEKEAAPLTEEEDPDAELKLTEAQWRELFRGQITDALIGKFIKAHNLGYATDETFYSISYELFASSNQETQKFGQQIISQDNSPNAFHYMASNYSKIPEANRTLLWSVMATYAQPQKFNSLSKSLASKDPKVSMMAAQVLSIAVKKAKESESPTSSRNSPRDLANDIQSQNFNIFLPTLTTLGSSQDENLAQLAKSLLLDIQGLNTQTAQN